MRHITHYLLDRPTATDPYFDRVETHYDPDGIVELHFYVAGEVYKLDMRTPDMRDYVDRRWYLLSISRGRLAPTADLMQELEKQNAAEHLPELADNLSHIINMVIDRAYLTLPVEVGNRKVPADLDKEPALDHFRTADRPGAFAPVYLGDFRVAYDRKDGNILEQERYGHWWRLLADDIDPFELQQILGADLTVQQFYSATAFSWVLSFCYG